MQQRSYIEYCSLFLLHTQCAMSQTVHGERLLSFSDQLGFAVKPLSSAHNLVIDVSEVTIRLLESILKVVNSRCCEYL